MTATETSEKKVFTLEHSLALKLLLGFGVVMFLFFAILSLPDDFKLALAFIGFASLNLFTLNMVGKKITFDDESISYQPFLRKPKTITWQDIGQVKAHPIYEGLIIYGINGQKLFTVDGFPNHYFTFVSYMGDIRTDLFDLGRERVFTQNPLVTMLIAAITIGGALLFWKVPEGRWFGVLLVLLGSGLFLYLPRRLSIMPDQLILKSFIHTHNIYPQAISYIDLLVSQSSAYHSSQIAIVTRNPKRRLPLLGLSQSTAMLYIYLMNWWEARIPYLIVLDGQKEYGPCECCGNISRRVWGDIEAKRETAAVYFVNWTRKRPDHGANFDLILGKWGKGTSAEDRYAVSLEFRILQGQPQFMVIDAQDRPAGQSELVGAALSREQVIDTPLAQKVFDMVDEICAQDPRIAELYA